MLESPTRTPGVRAMNFGKTSMSLVVISQVPPPVHGSTVMTRIFLETIGNLGHSARLVDRRFSSTMDEVGKPSVGKVFKAFSIAMRLARVLLKEKPDACILFATTRRGSLVVDWMLSEILRLFRVPTYLYLHTVGYRALSEGSKTWAWIIRRLFYRVKTVVILSPSLGSDVEGFAPLSPRYAVANTVDEALSRSPRSRPSQKSVVYMSNLIREKGAMDFVAVAERVLKTTSAHFSLIGAHTDSAFTDELCSQISDLGLGNHVTIVGPLYGEEKWRMLENASVLVFPSQYEFEAQPLTIIEALHVGTPVISYEVGAVGDCVIPGVTGWLADPGDVDELANRLSLLLEDDASRAAMSEASRALYEEKFSRNAYERKWHRILD